MTNAVGVIRITEDTAKDIAKLIHITKQDNITVLSEVKYDKITPLTWSWRCRRAQRELHYSPRCRCRQWCSRADDTWRWLPPLPMCCCRSCATPLHMWTPHARNEHPHPKCGMLYLHNIKNNRVNWTCSSSAMAHITWVRYAVSFISYPTYIPK